MPDFQKLQETKSKILSLIQEKGPSMPTRVARESGLNSLFISAFLAELVSENKLMITNMKVGSSPIYYLQGQEEKLQDFTEHLNHKEKEAFLLLKKSKILEDLSQTPAIRVALRNLKDFGIPVQVKIDKEVKLFWKFFLLTLKETKEEIEKRFIKKTKQQVIQKTPNPATQTPNHANISVKKENLNIFDRTPEKNPKNETKNQKEDLELKKLVKSHLQKNNLEITEEISSKKREYTAKVQHFSQLFGNQLFYLISKDKKKITENDLALALQKSQTEKMPSILLSSGVLDKKAELYLEEWKNLIKFQKL